MWDRGGLGQGPPRKSRRISPAQAIFRRARCAPAPLLAGRDSTVDVEHLPGYEVGGRGGEKQARTHDILGIGDPAQGNYAGLPGKMYARVMIDAMGNRGELFTEAVDSELTSIPPLATDSTSYTFELPRGTTETFVRARVIYRRAYKEIVDIKGWTETGIGAVLHDIQTPHFGFLMENFSELPKGPIFIRGDCNADNLFNIADAIFALNVLFSGGGPEPCTVSCDANADTLFNIADAIYILQGQFAMGRLPPAPHPSCGVDPAPGVPCGSFPPCL